MPLAEILGLIAGALTTGSFVPQVVRVIRLRSAREISLLFTTMFLVGISFWIAYGVYLSLPSVIAWNAAALILSAILLYAKLRFDR
jgi:MtN3 and saliva related transmembrane protein